ncbi:MAG: ATP-binding cassette domain-containing protein, partial [Spirochaetales bacterium]|nr:ATP-binding cassette domain-containing protein [Spirochaetales bacterium]
LQTPQSGRIEGIDQPCALMFQEDRLLEWADALTNVVLVLDSKKDSHATEKAERMLEQVGIDPKMPIRKMSGGMRRRVALARALVFDAPTLLLDEPFKGLDENLMKKCASIVRDTGKLAIVSTHSVEEAQALGSEIVRLS